MTASQLSSSATQSTGFGPHNVLFVALDGLSAARSAS